MKKRKTLKELYNEHEDGIQIFVIVTIAIALFVGGFLVGWNFMEKPMSDSQFEMCEQIARDVYEQKGQVIVEAPEDFSVSMTTTTITVKSAEASVRGKVDASLHNGELVMERSLETGEAVFISILMGILFFLLGALIFCIVCMIQEKVQKRRQS